MSALPQDVRSPIQQSRWVLAKNNSGTEIPAFGVCEVLSNSNDSSTGVDMLQVARPSAHGLPECVVNSFVPISAGGYGWVTYDFPAYALGSVYVGDMCGTQKDSFSLSKGKPGFMCIGSGPDGSVRVKDMWECVIRGTLGSELCPDTTEATIASSYVSRNSLGVTKAQNIYKLAGASGAQVALQWDGKGKDENGDAYGGWAVLQVEHRKKALLTDVLKGTGCKIDKKSLENLSVMYCNTETQSTAVTFTTAQVVTDVGLSDGVSGSGSSGTGTCSIQANFKTICVLDTPTDDGWFDVVTFEPRVVMSTIRQNQLCLEGYIQTIYVPCASDGEYVDMVCGTDCSSGSG